MHLHAAYAHSSKMSHTDERKSTKVEKQIVGIASYRFRDRKPGCCERASVNAHDKIGKQDVNKQNGRKNQIACSSTEFSFGCGSNWNSFMTPSSYCLKCVGASHANK